MSITEYPPGQNIKKYISSFLLYISSQIFYLFSIHKEKNDRPFHFSLSLQYYHFKINYFKFQLHFTKLQSIQQ